MPYLIEVDTAVILLIDVAAALATHAWFRKNEPETTLYPLLALVAIPSPMAYCAGITGSLTNIAAIYALFAATLLTSITIYRLSPVHPLASYPGPALCKITKLWTVYIAYRGKLQLHYKALHDVYGPIVRVGPNELSIVDKEIIPSVLGANGMPKGPLWDGRQLVPSQKSGPRRSESLIDTRDTRYHTQLRKPWNKAFGSTPMSDYEDLMIQRAVQLSEHFHEIAQKSPDRKGHIDLAHWISFFSFDFMGDMAFGGGFELMRDGDTEGVWAGMEKALFVPSMTQHIPWIAALLRNMPYFGSDIRKFLDFAFRQAYKRSKANVQKRDLFYYLLAATDPDSTVDPFPLILQNSVLAIIAGSDTTSSVISNIFYFLLRHPRYLKMLREEVDANFPSEEGGPITTSKLSSMKMLNAIINETLRLQPPVPTSVQRAPAQGSEGKMIGNHFIAEGTAVNIPPYVLHRRSQYFSPRPDDYWPERWILGEKESDRKRYNITLDHAAFIPFSMGPANCAGKTLALLELRYITAMLVREFDLAFEPGYSPETWESVLQDRLVLKKGLLPVVLTERKPSA